MYTKKEKIHPAYDSKHNSRPEKQFIILTIPNGKRRYYLAVEKLFSLLRRISSNHVDDFYCLNCLLSFRTKNKIESHKNVCKNGVVLLSEDTKLLDFNRYQKSDKLSSIIYVDFKLLMKEIDGYKNNPEKSSSTKVG